jgi:hypothetical protein
VAKLEADMFEAAKNTSDRSANAMSEFDKKAKKVKKLIQCIDSLLQMLHQSTIKQMS